MKVNLGCGTDYRPGWLNCDRNNRVRADVYFDFERFPYPLESATAEEIHMLQVMEHLDGIPDILDELWRILIPGGILHIEVPYGKSDWALQDVTHKHCYTERSFVPFCEKNVWYSKHRFDLVRTDLEVDSTTIMHRLRNLIPFRKWLRYFLFNMYDRLTVELRKPL